MMTCPRCDGRKVLALNGRRREQDAAQPGRMLFAMEEVRGREGEGKAQVERHASPEPQLHVRGAM
jgi:hypothetical protein